MQGLKSHLMKLRRQRQLALRVQFRLAGVVQVRPDSSLLWFRRLSTNPLGGVAVLLDELEMARG